MNNIQQKEVSQKMYVALIHFTLTILMCGVVFFDFVINLKDVLVTGFAFDNSTNLSGFHFTLVIRTFVAALIGAYMLVGSVVVLIIVLKRLSKALKRYLYITLIIMLAVLAVSVLGQLIGCLFYVRLVKGVEEYTKSDITQFCLLSMLRSMTYIVVIIPFYFLVKKLKKESQNEEQARVL